MQNHKLKDQWKPEHTKVFIELKAVLTSKPVLRAPKWDGSKFIVISDSCKEGFAAVLMQTFQVKRKDGTTKEKRFLITFASKQMSAAERSYKPFLLEFAALKYSLDKFSDII
ncbi:hypothetical protein Moror_9648 [Moniliophthora roreri MCA 2997]|uniref:Reverse transcriptase/retrotransposon-derived protein RNase H-like domain-containing protein n=2 Tax=Moniliophthora roreri TaxID=221103 RepID=V2WMJ5_MONRO|nr:hypothetical protein Moror_9648 [Moniliophthora roreri MCA 2997]